MFLEELAQKAGFDFFGDPKFKIFGVSDIHNTKPGYLSFGHILSLKDFCRHSPKVVWVVPEKHSFLEQGLIVANHKQAMASILPFFKQKQENKSGISKFSDLDESAKVHPSVSVGSFSKVSENVRILEGSVLHSQVYVGKGCKIGKNCVLFPGVVLMDGVTIGDNCILHPGVKLGSDGLGFFKEDQKWSKIEHLASVWVGDDVEIGPNTCVDRGVLSDTVIESGTKIDSLVHIAHNVRIGTGCMIAAQSGISGSANIGDCVTIGGQVGIADHVSVANNVLLCSRSGLTKDINQAGAVLSGFPAQNHKEEIKQYVGLRSFIKKKIKQKKEKK